MKQNINYKTGYKKVKIADIIRVLLTIHNRIPEGQALTPEESACSGKDIMIYGSDKYERAKLGVFISSKDLTPFADYLIECMKDNELVNVATVGLFTHKNQAPIDEHKNCETMEADFAEIKLITTDKTLNMFVNYKDNVTRKIGTYVEVHNTSWKRFKPRTEGQSKKDWILDRIVVEAAMIAELQTNKRFKTKEQFLKHFNSVEAIEPNEIIKRIKTSKITRDGGMRVLNLSELEEKEIIRVLKMVYNKIKNDTLKVTVAEGKEDKTHVELLYNGRKLGLWTSFNSKIMEYEG